MIFAHGVGTFVGSRPVAEVRRGVSQWTQLSSHVLDQQAARNVTTELRISPTSVPLHALQLNNAMESYWNNVYSRLRNVYSTFFDIHVLCPGLL
jgi:hypothetical protein